MARAPDPGRTGDRHPARGRPAPTATYRLQLSPGFTFADAEDTVDHLWALGVSHVYLSPVLQAAPGSTHGYDTVDHTRVSAELGGAEGLRRLVARLRERGLGAVADIVPNHMAVPVPESLNRPLFSVLRDGPSSPCAQWFDIDWEAQDQAVLMPVLGRRIGECLAAGEIVLDVSGSEPVVRYYGHVLPVRPGTESLPLPELLETQWYRLAYWRVADEELNYRRFFDVDTLAAIRVEEPDVFDATHALILSMVADGTLDGLRIDHPDGLADPRGYLRRLGRRTAATGGAWVVVEKILADTEELPADWPCAGTTGYDAAAMVCGLFVDPAGAGPLTGAYTRFTGSGADFAEVAEAAKRQVLSEALRAEVRRLSELLAEIWREDIRLADHTPSDLRDAVTELLVAFGVYRTYAVPGEEPSAQDVAAMEQAAALARTRLAASRHATLDLVRDLALGRHGGGGARDEFLVRFQQTSAPVMAKGVEDTAFYRWSRLLSCNEVGSDPARFGVEPAAFHAFCGRLQRDRPLTMTTLSTHDSKRSEDVRARLAVLSELPDEWRRAVTDWSARAAAALDRGRDARSDYREPPDPETEYQLWQTLVGAWPLDEERLGTYLRKAMREAKRRTSWVAPDEGYEHAALSLARLALADRTLGAEVARFVGLLAPYARVNSLGQKLLQLAMPGLPDVYQGSELVTLTLVDPDNRRPVDFRRRRDLLDRSDRSDRSDGPRDLDGEKLLVTSRVLRLRRDRPEWFGADATYRPLAADGPAAPHLVAFLRSEAVAAVATRLPAGLARRGGWGATRLTLPNGPAGRWRDLLTGARHAGGPVAVSDLLAELPVALLVRGAEAGGG
jgi:(1->4)-alpha-D-glucan 1-alpha-D-glucosylmutase